MAIDLAALKARLAAQSKGSNNVTAATVVNDPISNASKDSGPTSVVASTTPASSGDNIVVPTVNAPAVLGTSKTSEIEHLDFLSKMNSLAEAIHKQHPTMPVLLMQIHKQLRNDPELVTTLDEDAIGVIVKGLQVQTKTELVTEAVKKSSNPRTKKNASLSTDMF